jgi:Flp pilus assembly protein CpaB
MARPGRPATGGLLLGAAVPWWHRSRRPRWRWGLTIALAAVALVVVQHRLDQAEAVIDGLGATRTVAVARHDLEPGHVITGDDTARRDLPVAGVAGSAMTDDPVGRTVTATIVAGEAVSSTRLAPDGVSGLAALVPAGRSAIAIPVPDAALRLARGDRIDVLDPSAADAYAPDGSAATVVARRATVLALDDSAVTVSVTAEEAAAVAAALAHGTPVLALTGAGPEG